MVGSGERAYAFAKASGIIGKSFIGHGMSRLDGVSRLSELDRLIFPQDPHDLPEWELLMDLEERISGRAVKQINTIVSSFAKPPELWVRLFRVYEYADVKSVLSAAAQGETVIPPVTDIGKFGTVRFEAYPDLKAMFRGTEFEWILKENEHPHNMKEQFELQIKIDRDYYNLLWNSVIKLPEKDREYIYKILSDEISLKNCAWALRLRIYYQLQEEDIRRCLVDIKPGKGKPSLAAEAEKSLSMALDNYADWAKWRWVSFLNPAQSGEGWTADARYFQNASARHLYRLARFYFRRRPFSLDVVSCFIKLKQFEEDLLTSLAEGLSLGMGGREVLSLQEVRS
ncbi:V-type ATPase subunit [Treponema sp. OttesenSCG-928-L16]|nr:V-type ATPase subunit [Treponema sp. OttesenSCG-928-L16]